MKRYNNETKQNLLLFNAGSVLDLTTVQWKISKIYTWRNKWKAQDRKNKLFPWFLKHKISDYNSCLETQKRISSVTKIVKNFEYMNIM